MVRLDLKKKLTARSDRVKSVDLHPTEPWMLCSLFSGGVYIWNYQTQTMIKSFEATDTPVRCAKFIARKQWIVTASDDMTVRVYNYNTMKKVKQFEAHNDYIRSVAVHPSQPFLLTSSDDMSIKLWDWEKDFANVMIFEGHTHYVMQVVFNPKDPNTFASASLDGTVKVWGLNSPTPYFSLLGHERGVNCVDYISDGDKPYLISGSDDHTAKIWDYQSKTCVVTLEGHTANVSAVCFHPELPVVATASEDGTVRLWNSATYRPEKLVNEAMERAWALAAVRGSNVLAVGYDEGALVLKFGRDQPPASMDAAGKLVWAKHSEVFSAAVRGGSGAAAADGERMALAAKELGRTEVYPRGMAHDPSGRFVAVIGDGEYTIYTALAWRNKSFGKGLDFVWGDAPGAYAVREAGGRIKVFANFKENLSIKPPFAPEGLYGGALIGVRGQGALVFYDWEGRLVRRIEVVPKTVVWAENGEYLAIATDTAFYVLRYHAAEVARAFATGGSSSSADGEEGIEAALEVVHEERERVRGGQWVGDCFLYLSAANKLCYCVGAHVFPVAHLDRRMYFLRYIPRDSKAYLIDKALGVCAYTLHLAVINYQTAVLRGDAETAARLLPDVPLDQRTRIARFLQAQGHLADALAITTDDDHRFELALQLARLDDALAIARKTPANDHRWRMLADLALRRSRFDLAEECLTQCRDVAGLLLLYTSTADAQALTRLAATATALGKYNVAFVCHFVTRNVDACLDLLCDTDRLPEAALMARTYAPSRVSPILKRWKEALAKSNPKAAEALADPNDFPNLFPDIAPALAAEKLVFEEYKTAVESAEYEEYKDFLARNLIQEAKDAAAAAEESAKPAAEEMKEEEKEEEEEKKVETEVETPAEETTPEKSE